MSPPNAAPYTSAQYPPYLGDGSLRRASVGGDQSRMTQGKQSAYRTKPCRYDQAGYCRSGAACPFMHNPDGDFQDHNCETGSGDASRSPPASARVRPSISIPSPSYPVYPTYLRSPPWPSHVGPNASPSNSPVASQVHPIPGRVPVSLVPTPFGGNPFDPNSHFRSSSSESPSSLLDDLVTPLEDLRLSEPFVRRQSYPLTTPCSSAGQYGPIISPTSGYPGLSQYVDRFGVPSPKPGSLSHHTRRSSSQSSRKLAASYKTKPCKFWRQDGACPNGQACSFIHDEDIPGTATSQSSEESTEIGSPSSAHSSQFPYDLPAKPLSAIEEKKKHGFYPISWRVIGGGVMMGGKPGEFCRSYADGYCENGDDCPFAHDAESDGEASPPSEIDLEEGYYDTRPPSIPHVVAPPNHRVEGKPKGIRPISITIPAAANFLPASEASNSALPTAVPSEKKGGKGSTKSSASHRRTRSMSIPPTPGSPRLGTVNLFPAESPGGL